MAGENYSKVFRYFLLLFMALLWRRKKPIEFNYENHSRTEFDLNQWIILENENSRSKKGHKNIKTAEHGSDEYYGGNSRTYCNNDCGQSEKENDNTYMNLQQKAPKYEFIVANYIKLMSNYNFRIMLLGLMLNSVELVVSLTHIVEYAIELKIPRKLANILLTFLSGGSIVGRVVFGRVFDLNCINKVLLFKLLLFISGIAGSFSTNFIHLAIFDVCYGMASGACLAQKPVIIQLVVSSEMMPNGWILVSFCQSLTIMDGTLIVGWIADLSRNYRILFYVTAGSVILSELTLMFMRHDYSETSQGNLKPRTLKNYDTYASIY